MGGDELINILIMEMGTGRMKVGCGMVAIWLRSGRVKCHVKAGSDRDEWGGYGGKMGRDEVWSVG